MNDKIEEMMVLMDDGLQNLSTQQLYMFSNTLKEYVQKENLIIYDKPKIDKKSIRISKGLNKDDKDPAHLRLYKQKDNKKSLLKIDEIQKKDKLKVDSAVKYFLILII